MKRTIGIIMLLLGYCAGRLQAQTTVSFNFSAGTQTVSGWTNVAGDPSTGVRTATASGITISSVATGNWSPYAGSAYDGGGASGGTFFPAAVMLNHWFQYNNFYAGYNAAIPQLEITGLNIDSVYTLKMTGSFTLGIGSSYELNPIRYSVAGTSVYGYIDVNGDYNTANGAVFYNIAPDPTGMIKVYVNTISSTNVASICGIQIIRGHTSAPTPSVTLTNPVNNDALPEDGNITIAATASESGGSISKVEFYADTTLIGVDSTAPYGMIWYSPDPGNYTLTARAVDGSGNTSTSTVAINVESLNNFWSTTGNIATNGDSSFVGTVDTNRLSFRTNNIERMTILKDGTIGIGTKTTYGYALAVNGTGIFTKVKVKTAGTWPDYVFDKDYILPDLSGLERYIALHKHLPGIAPESEVQKEGIDMAGHAAALLKKVEELTLYLIDENKRLKEQNRQLQEQNAKLQRQQQEIDELRKLIESKK